MASSDRKVLSYHDVLLRQADVALLKGPYWLNDQVMSFYLEYLNREKITGRQASSQPTFPHLSVPSHPEVIYFPPLAAAQPHCP
mmetsp:Transcript_40652/g.115088  ORF Transcript_40652/g.115088 Transcript_40652/m.115088 type:complete len:84 (-) Transcript_40652:240-491(-)